MSTATKTRITLKKLALSTLDEWYNATDKTFDRFVTVPARIHLNDYGGTVDLAVVLVYKAMAHWGKASHKQSECYSGRWDTRDIFFMGCWYLYPCWSFCPWSLCPRACHLTSTVTPRVQKHGKALKPSSLFSGTEKCTAQ